MYPQPYLEVESCSPPCLKSHYFNFCHHVYIWPVFLMHELNYRVYVFCFASPTQIVFIRFSHGVNCSDKFSQLYNIKLHGFISIYLFVLLLLYS